MARCHTHLLEAGASTELLDARPDVGCRRWKQQIARPLAPQQRQQFTVPVGCLGRCVHIQNQFEQRLGVQMMAAWQVRHIMRVISESVMKR